MLKFNELQITPDTGCLVIDVSILDQEAFEGCYITSIQIDNQDTYIPSGPSSSAQVVFPDNIEEGDQQKHVRIQIKSKDLSFYGFKPTDLFFVYVTTNIDHLTQPLDCGYDYCNYMGVVYNQKYLYNKSINYLKELDKRCKIPTYFIDWILKLKAFEIAICAG